MTDEHRIILTVDGRVIAHLTKMATAAGRNATRYAQELFEAAYAARCGFGQGDHALEAEVEKIDGRPAVAALPPAAAVERPAIAASAKREIERAIPAPSEDFGRLSRELATAKAEAAKVPELERQVRSLQAKLNQPVDAAEKVRIAKLEGEMSLLTRENFSQQATVRRLTSERDAQTVRAEEAESALRAAQQATPRPDAGAPAAQPISLAAEIAELQGLATVMREIVADQKLQGDQLDQLYRQTRATIDGIVRAVPPAPKPAPEATTPAAEPVPPAPEPRRAAKRPAAPQPRPDADRPGYVWPKNWGRG
jgi:site-specific DNA-cytosine methylase